MRTLPLLSVVITCYNRELYISAAIESVLASIFQDFELIICDDCSTDNTFQIAMKYAALDCRIQLYRNEHNIGDFPNRDKAASYAIGVYIKYVDSDDLIAPSGLATMLDAMLKYPEAAIGLCQIHNDKNFEKSYPVLINPERAYREHYYGFGTLRYGPTGAIIKRKILAEMGGFGFNRFIGDTELWLKIVAQYPMVKIEPDLVTWRRHTRQEFYIGHKEHFYIEKLYLIYLESLRAPKCPLNQSDVERIIKRLHWKHARDILKVAFRHGEFKVAIKIFKKTGLNWNQLVKGLYPYNKIKKSFEHTI